MSLTETPVPARPDDTPEAALGRMRRLLDVSVALAGASDLDALLDRIARTTTEVLRCEAAAILLHDARTDTLRFAAATGDEAGALADVVVPLDASLAGTAFREGRPVLAVDAEADERHFAEAAQKTGLRPRVLLAVPMRVEGEPVGVLEAINPDRGPFDHADTEALDVVAAQAAVALRGARQRDALEEANARLLDLDRLKTNFMSITSHELRTPLTAVLGFGQVLRDEAADDLAPFAQAVVEAGDRMMETVDTIDEMSGMSAGASRPEPVSLADLLADAVRELPRAVRVALPDAPLTVRADRRRLRLALAGLLRNAHQFTPPSGRVSVAGRVGPGEVALQVHDTGRGIDPADLERIFEPFVQIADPDTRDHEGLGVGLAVARSVVDRHGGRLWATSEGRGRGATFHVPLPRA